MESHEMFLNEKSKYLEMLFFSQSDLLSITIKI